MLKRTIIVIILLISLVTNTVFPQAITLDSTNLDDIQEVPENDSNDSDLYQDYTTGERLGMGALNIFGGAGSITKGNRTGWLVTGIQGVGLLSILGGVIYGVLQIPAPPSPPGTGNDGLTNQEYIEAKDRYDSSNNLRRGLITAGSVVIGTGVVVGFIIPFFHHRANNASNISENNYSQSEFPFKFDLVSNDGQNINGLKVMYSVSF